MAKKLTSILVAIVMILSSMTAVMMVAAEDPVEIYKDPTKTVAERVTDLMSKMTDREKIAQCIQGERATTTQAMLTTENYGSVLSGGGSVPTAAQGGNTVQGWTSMVDGFQTASANSRLGIPIIYGIDAVHGNNNVVNATIFPHNIGLGATRDADLVKKIGRATAEEMAATGIFWDFAPCLANPQNIRWGRSYEGYGSDANLVAELGTAFIKGMQGETEADLKNGTSAVACMKHFCAEGYTVDGVNQGNALLDYDSPLFQEILKPYKAAIAAGALTLMPTFNSINGLKSTANYLLLTTVLKEQLGFKGFLIGDWNAHTQITAEGTGLVRLQNQIVIAFNAGLDMFMVGSDTAPTNTMNQFVEAYNAGRITPARLDDAVARILSVKFKLGLFDNKRYSDPATASLLGSDAHRDIARQAVRESMVLLKNKNDIVSKLKDMGKIYVAGKSADNIGRQCGGWTISWQGSQGAITKGTTILQGIQANVKEGTTVTYSQNGSVSAAGYDAAVVVLGENPYAEGNGDARDPGTGVRNIRLDNTDLTCLSNIKASNPDIPIIVVLVSGRPLLVTDQIGGWDALIAAWLPGTEGDGIGQVLFKDEYNFTGKLSTDWPKQFADIGKTTATNVTGNSGIVRPLFPYGYGLQKGLASGVKVMTDPIYVNEDFTFKVTTSMDVNKLQLANANGTPVSVKSATKETIGDAYVWTVKTAVGTVGKSREFYVVTPNLDGTNSQVAAFTVDINPPTDAIVSAGFTGAPASTKVNVPTEVTVVTSNKVASVAIQNASGSDMGKTLVSKTSNTDGTITWKYTIKIGTAGNNRVFYAVSGVVKSSPFSINVTLI